MVTGGAAPPAGRAVSFPAKNPSPKKAQNIATRTSTVARFEKVSFSGVKSVRDLALILLAHGR